MPLLYGGVAFHPIQNHLIGFLGRLPEKSV